jgi:hypothetical protein
MSVIPLEFSIVVVGQDCNPTILNPDFLKYRKIVLEQWGWEVVNPPITTPAFATVSYNSGVTVKVEPTRFQVVDNKNAEDISQSKAVEIAQGYIRVLPHVRYTGVGINFRSLVEMEQPDVFLKERFLKPGPWDTEYNLLIGTSIKLVYSHDDGRLNLSLDGGVFVRKQGDRANEVKGVFAHANYHRNCQGYPTDQKVLAHITRANSDGQHFDRLVTELLASSQESI